MNREKKTSNRNLHILAVSKPAAAQADVETSC